MDSAAGDLSDVRTSNPIERPPVTLRFGRGSISDIVNQPAVFEHSSVIDPSVSISGWEWQQVPVDEAWTPERVHRALNSEESVDATEAFERFRLYKYCIAAPSNYEMLDREVGRVQEAFDEWIKKNPNRQLEWAEEDIDDAANAFELCRVLNSSSMTMAERALFWLERAADLGHMMAQRLYHAEARELLVGTTAGSKLINSVGFANPEKIYEFQRRCDQYATALLKLGHPQGYLLITRLLADGDVYERDLPLAYAYALLAQRTDADGVMGDARVWQRLLGGMLPQDALAEAECLADEIAPKF